VKLTHALLTLFFLAACGNASGGPRGDESPGPMLPEPVPLPECPDADYSSCDIREGDCQTRIAALAACVRDSEAVKNLQIDVLTEDEYAEVLRQDWADTPVPAVPHFDQALSLLGLGLAEGVERSEDIQNQVEWLGGVYRTKERRIVIIDHGRPADSPYIDSTLLHELIHSQQDADYDLANWPAPDAVYTFDQRMARSSVVEGEASFYEYRAGVPLLGIDITQVSFQSTMVEHLRYELGQAASSPTPYGSSYVTFPYGYGAAQAYEAWKRGGPRNIDTLWGSPPTNSQAVISALYGIDTPQPSGIDLTTPEIPSFVPYADDVLGAWGVMLFLIEHDAEWADVAPTALAWRGDHIWVYTDENDAPTYLLWEVELATADAANLLNDTFDHGVADSPPYEHGVTGTRVFVNASFHRAPEPVLTTAGNVWLSGT
jgi:hypothetical protein